MELVTTPQSTSFISTLKLGRVVDLSVKNNVVFVRCDGNTTIPCAVAVAYGNYIGYGPVATYTPPIGSIVLVYIPTTKISSLTNQKESVVSASFGYIIAVIPALDADFIRIWRDWINPQTAEISNISDLYTITDQLYKNQVPGDFSLCQPLDRIAGSDLAYLNEFGCGFGLSKFFSWLRGSDIAGIWCFFLDNFVRLAAYNYTFWSSLGEHHIRDQKGLISSTNTETMYTWEACGLPTNNVVRFKDGVTKSELFYEPAVNQQDIRPRRLRVSGFYGDLEHDYVIRPVTSDEYKNTDKPRYETATNKSIYTGLSDIARLTDGTCIIRSAKAIVLEKTIYIPVPKQILSLDAEENIVVNDKIEWTWDAENQNKSWLWSIELEDYMAYLLNWYGIQTLAENNKYWYVPEEGFFDAQSRSESINLSGLSTSFAYPTPAAIDIQIDHRSKSSKYYISKSRIIQMPDGSIILEGAFGETIKMSGGNIFISAPGDIWLQSGRNTVQWAGHDAIIRANDSIDITTSHKDVRIKSERNLHMLAGNSGTEGGVLLETRAPESAVGSMFTQGSGASAIGEDVISYGIILKTKEAPIELYSSQTYIKALKDSSDENGTGTIIMEADSAIIESAVNSVLRCCPSGFYDILTKTLRDLDTSFSSSDRINKFTSTETLINSSDVVYLAATSTYLNGGITVRQNILHGGTLIQQPSLVSYFPTFSSLDSVFVGWYELWVYYLSLFVQQRFMEYIAKIGFTCRTAEQYMTNMSTFVIPEHLWQAMFRQQNQGAVWKEPIVYAPDGTATAPHPGYSKWHSETGYLQYTPKLINANTRAAITRSSTDYITAAKSHAVNRTVLENNYKILVNH